jgi:transposase InsO family protein
MFQEFAKEWGFQHITSSPTYPQSNGKAEATVKSMKKLIQASWTGNRLDEGKLARALLQYRNTLACRDGLSPAQKLFGQPIQDLLPAHRRAFAPQWQKSAEEAERRALSHTNKIEQYYNQHAQELPEIRIGSKVAPKITQLNGGTPTAWSQPLAHIADTT